MSPKLVLALIVVVVVVGIFGYNKRVGTNQRMVEVPLANDKYIADFSSFIKTTPPSTWGVVKVVAVRGDQVELAFSKSAYNKSKGPERDYDNGKASAPDYYHEKTLVVPHAALLAAVKENGILYVKR